MPHPQQSQWNAFKAGSCVSRLLCILTIRDDEVVMIQRAPAYAALCILTIPSIGMVTIKSS
jgi:hypothetical protein